MNPADEVLRGAVATLPLELAILDASGTIVFTNETWHEFGRENELVGDPATIGVDYLDVCDAAAAAGDETAGEIADGLRDLLAGGQETFTVEYPCHSPDEKRWFLMYAAPYTAEGERYVQVSHLDVTDRKENELAVERRNERLQAVASILSHDLRNPLTVAQGYLDSLAERVDGEEIGHISTALRRMTTIIADALILARGTDVGTLEPTDLGGAAERAWENVETKDATLEVTGSTTFEADRSLLGNLLENLFRNAVTHGGEDVTVRVGPLGDEVGFFVADDGPGIPPDIRDSIFETGFTTRREAGSTGLGLTIVAEIAEGHGWDVELADSAAGGARFEIRGVTPVESY